MFRLMIHWLHINQSRLWKMSRITAMTNRFPPWQSPLPFQCTHQRNPIPLQPLRPHSLVTVISTLLSLNHVIKSLALEECAWEFMQHISVKIFFFISTVFWPYVNKALQLLHVRPVSFVGNFTVLYDFFFFYTSVTASFKNDLAFSQQN